MVMDLRSAAEIFDGKARNETVRSSATADAEYYFGWTYGDNGKKATWSYYENMINNCYDRKAKRLTVLDGQGNGIGRYRGSVDDVDIGSEPIRFSCYLDHSLLEIYLNETKSVSLRNYFTQPRYFQVCGNVQSMQLWEMTPAYPET
jgi:hypothetical protein